MIFWRMRPAQVDRAGFPNPAGVRPPGRTNHLLNRRGLGICWRQQKTTNGWFSHRGANRLSKGEVPVGAVVVRDGRRWPGHNLRGPPDPTAHAELIALQQASGAQ